MVAPAPAAVEIEHVNQGLNTVRLESCLTELVVHVAEPHAFELLLDLPLDAAIFKCVVNDLARLAIRLHVGEGCSGTRPA